MRPFPSFATFLTWSCLGLFLIAICPNTSLAQTKSAYFLQKGDSLQTLGLYPLAIAQYQKAAELFEQDENWEGYVSALNGMGHSYYYLDKLDAAYDALSKSLRIGKEKLPPQHPQLAQSFFYLGKYYFELNESEKSIEAHQKALKIRVNVYGENHEQVADSYYYLGNVYLFNLFDYLMAEKYFQLALEIREANHMESDLASSCYSLGALYRQTMDFEKARIYAQNAYRLSITSQNKPMIRNCLNLLANILFDQQEFTQAITYYKLTIESMESGDRPNLESLLNVYNNLGTALRKTMNFEEAMDYFKLTITINLNSDWIDSVRLSNSYIHLGEVYSDQKQFGAAIDAYKKCGRIRLKTLGEKHAETAGVYRDLGELYYELDSLNIALQYYQKSLISLFDNFQEEDIYVNPDITPGNSRNDMLNIIFLKAQAFSKLYDTQTRDLIDLKTALELYSLADQLNDLARNSDLLEESKLFLIEYFQSGFEAGVRCAFQLYHITKDPTFLDFAFKFIEKSKYMLVFQSLTLAQNENQLGLADSIREQEHDLKAQISSNKQLLLNEEEKGPLADKAIITSIETKIFKLIRSQENLKNQIAREYPNYYQIKYDSVTLNLEQIQQYLDPQSVILEYYVGDSTIYAMSISKQEVAIKQIKFDEELRWDLLHYLLVISRTPNLSSDLLVEKNFNDFTRLSHGFFDYFIRPFVGKLKLGEKFIIIPSGIISYLPFETLIKELPATNEPNFKELSYLIKDHQISYAYSSNLLFRNREKRGSGKTQDLLAFSYSASLKGSEGNGRKSANLEIPGTARELKAIASVMQGSKNQFLMGKEATEHQFKILSPAYDIIHLAIHGTADRNNSINSRLIFNSELDTVEDGSLFAHELFNLNLKKLKLAVLSACETGVGKEYKGEGVLSVARGFAYAGCPSIVMSLWPVNDRFTANLMSDFYRELSLGLPIAKALQQAKLSFIKNQDEFSAHPANWSAFIPLGDMSPISSGSFDNIWRWLLIFFILVAGVYYFYKKRK